MERGLQESRSILQRIERNMYPNTPISQRSLTITTSTSASLIDRATLIQSLVG